MKVEQVDARTLQQAADYAVQKVVEQGYRCYSEEASMCIYSDGKGGRCIVGWLLDYEKYGKKLDNNDLGAVVELDEIADLDIPDLILDNLDFFTCLQEFHDLVSRLAREGQLKFLRSYGIDTSGAWWQKWVEMGDEKCIKQL